MLDKRGLPEVTKNGNAEKGTSKHKTLTVHVRRWVRWWFYVGVVCGAVALANIFFRHLTRTQEIVILFLGVVFWVLGGLVCWAWEGIQIEKAVQAQASEKKAEHAAAEVGRKIQSEFLSGAKRQSRLRKAERIRLLHEYLRRWEKQHNA